MTRMRLGAGLGPLVFGLALAWGPAASAQESWDAVYLAGAKVGYIHTFVEPIKDHERDLVRVRVDMVLTFKRLDNEFTMELRYGTIETPQGSVLRLDTRTLTSSQELRAHGEDWSLTVGDASDPSRRSFAGAFPAGRRIFCGSSWYPADRVR